MNTFLLSQVSEKLLEWKGSQPKGEVVTGKWFAINTFWDETKNLESMPKHIHFSTTQQEEQLWINVWIYPLSLLIDTKLRFKKAKQANGHLPRERNICARNRGNEPLNHQFLARSKQGLKYFSPSSQINSHTFRPWVLNDGFSLAGILLLQQPCLHWITDVCLAEITATAYLVWEA